MNKISVKDYIVEKVRKWMDFMLSQYKNNNAFLSVRVSLLGHDLDTKENVIGCYFDEGLHLKDDIEYIELKELKEIIKNKEDKK